MSAAGDGYRVATGGLPYFGRAMAGLLTGDGWQAAYLETRGWRLGAALRTLRQAQQADVLYQLGGQIARGSRPHLLALAMRRPLVMHWTGTDVLYARHTARRHRATSRLQRGVIHWAGAPWLVDELRAAGVTATWQPHSAIEAPPTLPPFPETFTVLTYLRPGRERFYGSQAVIQVATALPEVRLLVAGIAELEEAPANIRCLGWVDAMDEVYAGCHALLRLPAHDGLAFMVQEALVRGRHAVWNHTLPGVREAFSATDAVTQIGRLRQQHQNGELPFNEAGAAYVRRRFNRERIRAELRAGLARAIEGWP